VVHLKSGPVSQLQTVYPYGKLSLACISPQQLTLDEPSVWTARHEFFVGLTHTAPAVTHPICVL